MPPKSAKKAAPKAAKKGKKDSRASASQTATQSTGASPKSKTPARQSAAASSPKKTPARQSAKPRASTKVTTPGKIVVSESLTMSNIKATFTVDGSAVQTVVEAEPREIKLGLHRVVPAFTGTYPQLTVTLPGGKTVQTTAMLNVLLPPTTAYAE